METYLFIDTETTGFKKSGELMQEHQGRVCQIAMILANKRGRVLSEFSTLIKPDGWIIGKGAQKIHGIHQEDCEQYGLRIGGVMQIFERLSSLSTKIVAHNEQFDRGMIDVEEAYCASKRRLNEIPKPQQPWFCTMKSNTHITGGKWPKLDEALFHYIGERLGDTAHDAMADTRACMKIFFAMKNT